MGKWALPNGSLKLRLRLPQTRQTLSYRCYSDPPERSEGAAGDSGPSGPISH